LIQNTLTSSFSVQEKARQIAESFFGTNDDPTQIKISVEAFEKFKSISPDSILYEIDEKGEPISWVANLPTTKELMNKFLNGEINERELMDLTTSQGRYSAVYLCAAFTLPEHRRKKLASKLMNESISRIPLIENFDLFSWSVSPEGLSMVKNMEREIGKIIHNKS